MAPGLLVPKLTVQPPLPVHQPHQLNVMTKLVKRLLKSAQLLNNVILILKPHSVVSLVRVHLLSGTVYQLILQFVQRTSQ